MESTSITKTIIKRQAIACDACRKSKKKCDGNTPCFRCKRNNKVCTFSPQKRKTPAGATMTIDTNQPVTRVFDEQVFAIEHFKPVSGIVGSNQNQLQLINEKVNAKESLMGNLSIQYKYLEMYFSQINPTFFIETEFFKNGDKMTSKKSKGIMLQHNSALAASARSNYDKQQMKIYEKRAKILASELFDEITPDAAQGFSLLAFYYWGKNTDRAKHYRDICLSLCKRIKKKYQHQPIEFYEDILRIEFATANGCTLPRADTFNIIKLLKPQIIQLVEKKQALLATQSNPSLNPNSQRSAEEGVNFPINNTVNAVAYLKENFNSPAFTNEPVIKLVRETSNFHFTDKLKIEHILFFNEFRSDIFTHVFNVNDRLEEHLEYDDVDDDFKLLKFSPNSCTTMAHFLQPIRTVTDKKVIEKFQFALKLCEKEFNYVFKGKVNLENSLKFAVDLGIKAIMFYSFQQPERSITLLINFCEHLKNRLNLIRFCGTYFVICFHILFIIAFKEKYFNLCLDLLDFQKRLADVLPVALDYYTNAKLMLEHFQQIGEALHPTKVTIGPAPTINPSLISTLVSAQPADTVCLSSVNSTDSSTPDFIQNSPSCTDNLNFLFSDDLASPSPLPFTPVPQPTIVSVPPPQFPPSIPFVSAPAASTFPNSSSPNGNQSSDGASSFSFNFGNNYSVPLVTLDPQNLFVSTAPPLLPIPNNSNHSPSKLNRTPSPPPLTSPNFGDEGFLYDSLKLKNVTRMNENIHY